MILTPHAQPQDTKAASTPVRSGFTLAAKDHLQIQRFGRPKGLRDPSNPLVPFMGGASSGEVFFIPREEDEAITYL